MKGQELIRVSRLMAERGMCSRREADHYIELGLVLVNGEPVVLGQKVHPDQEIIMQAEASSQQCNAVTILLNKPLGVVSAQAEDGHRPAISLVRNSTRWSADTCVRTFSKEHLSSLAVAGRLDLDSSGLLVLTQDGRIARQLIGPESDVEKEYLVGVKGSISEGALKLLRHGLSLDGRILRQAQVTVVDSQMLRFVLKEGRKRQIRRMCELVGLKVISLQRIRIGRIHIGQLPLGSWRYLADHETF